VSKKFEYFFALENISFNVKKNTFFGIVGENGAGKTTLLKILCGLTSPSFGNLTINGLNYKESGNQIKEIIGVSADESFLYDELTIYENLKFFDNLHFNFNKNELKNKINRLTTLFNLNDWIHEPIRNLSTGMKQKVDLIRTIIHHPSIIFLDEPFSGLDFKAIQIVIDLLKELKEQENNTIVLTTHKIDILPQLCDDLIVLKRGKINKFITKKDFNSIEIEKYF
jgi:ABC-2 type transport system ATP-binding protein